MDIRLNYLTQGRIVTIPSHIDAAGAPAAAGGQDPTREILKENSPPVEPGEGVSGRRRMRAAFYIDGFNLHGALCDIRDPQRPEADFRFLRWLNLRSLCESLTDRSKEEIVRVLWCSAEQTNDRNKLRRHQAYQKALRSVDVDIELGHFVRDIERCRASCTQEYEIYREKRGDLNVGIHAVADSLLGKLDICYIVSADSDQVATVNFIKANCPEVSVVVVAPPDREHSQHILSLDVGHKSISRAGVERCLFGPTVNEPNGKLLVERPTEYALPAGYNRAGNPGGTHQPNQFRKQNAANGVVVERKRPAKKYVMPSKKS